MKDLSKIIESYKYIDIYVNENKTGTIKDYIGKETGYVSSYKNSIKFTQALVDHGMYHDASEGATLYPDGRLIFFLQFKDVVHICRFFTEFYKFEDKFTGEDELHDGAWHLYFDVHGDPLTGVEGKFARFHLIYNAKSNDLDEIDKALDKILEQINKSKISST